MSINITIITAAWRESGLKKVIECIDNQTYKGKVEHIIINDNNEDVRKFLEDNKYFENNRHRHVIDCHQRFHYYGGINRNIGVLAAFSYLREEERDEDKEFVCFLDDDNIWEPEHLQNYIDVLMDNPEATMIGSDMFRVGANDANWKELYPCSIAHGKCDLGEFLYKTSLFRTYGFFWPRPKRKQKFDYELIEKMANGEGNKVFYTHQPTLIASYRKR